MNSEQILQHLNVVYSNSSLSIRDQDEKFVTEIIALMKKRQLQLIEHRSMIKKLSL